MSRRQKKKREEEHRDESWLVPYADILTLLLALFIVLFAMSSVNAQKFVIFSRTFNQMFAGGTGILNYNSAVSLDNANGETAKNPNTNQNQRQNPKPAQSNQSKSAQLQQQQQMYALLSKMNSSIAKNDLSNKLEVGLTSEGLLVTIRDDVLFDSGSADVRPQDIKTAREISNLLVMDPPRNIIISGHTDNVPISNSKYSSNWELSVMRAVNFMKVILQNKQLDPKYFSAKGYGEYQPVASNATPDGRAKNRRVEILISPNISQ